MVRASPVVPSQVRGLREAEQPGQDMRRAKRMERAPPCPPLPLSLVRGFGAPGPGALPALCCPLLATQGKVAAEPGALGQTWPMGVKCQTSVPSSFSAGRTDKPFGLASPS